MADEFRKEFEKEVDSIKDKYAEIAADFENDDMNNDTKYISEADKKAGWYYPLTKTEQKKEYGYVVAEQQRFLYHIQDGHLDIVDDYLENAAKKKMINVNAYDEAGWLPIHYAAQMNYTDILKALLKAGANPKLKDKVTSQDAMDIAQMGIDDSSGPSDEVIELLESYLKGSLGIAVAGGEHE
mmetsp:Transcript_130713/g.244559  ORF Transcript_130713/g.244559 Transcript_130713/m.244559 type:complete len:183 (+) Transcript_130713:103-651(+)